MSTVAQSSALLSSALIDHAKKIAKGIANGEVAPLIGAGLSTASGLPDWKTLNRRLVLLFQAFDPNQNARSLLPSEYQQLLKVAFGDDDLAIISFMRSILSAADAAQPRQLERLVYKAMYESPSESGDISSTPPVPGVHHHHLVALFGDSQKQLWTTNYDDLFETAATYAGKPVHVVTPESRRSSNLFTISHLHGYLPHEIRQPEFIEKHQPSVVLAEDDFHLIANDLLGWTQREFTDLFDRYRVLILGMSLSDPNLRRTLAVARSRLNAHPNQPKHMAVIRNPPASEEMDHLRQGWTRDYWHSHGVELVGLPDYDDLLPFLARIRHEVNPGTGGIIDLARKKCKKLKLLESNNRALAYLQLQKAISSIEDDFSIPKGEITGVGIQVIDYTRSQPFLTLAFRSDRDPDDHDPKKARRLSVHYDNPKGAAGHAFVSSNFLRTDVGQSVFDAVHQDSTPTRDFEGIICSPICDWSSGGLPLGVVYITVKSTKGRVFEMPLVSKGAWDEQPTVDKLASQLSRLSLKLFEKCG